VGILLDYRLGIQGSLVRLQSFVIQPWTVLCLCVLDTSPHTETTPKPGLKHSRTRYDTICFEKLEE
jgi:hypothetical protein